MCFGWQADVVLCHFLQACMWSETVFPLLSPSARPSGLPPVLESAMLICHRALTGTIPSVSEQGSSADVLLALCWPSLVPGGAQVPLSWGRWGCAVMVHVQHPGDLWLRLQNSPKLKVSAVCGAAKPDLQADGELITPSLSLIALSCFNKGKLYFLWGFSVLALSLWGVWGQGCCGELCRNSPRALVLHNPVHLYQRSFSLAQEDAGGGFRWEGDDWNGCDRGTLRFGTSVPKPVIVP